MQCGNAGEQIGIRRSGFFHCPYLDLPCRPAAETADALGTILHAVHCNGRIVDAKQSGRDDWSHKVPYTSDMPDQQLPKLTVESGETVSVFADGSWRVHALARPQAIAELDRTAARLPGDGAVHWNLTGITDLDHIGAQWLWNAWRRRRPQRLDVLPQHEDFFNRLEQVGTLSLPTSKARPLLSGIAFSRIGATVIGHSSTFVGLLGQLTLDVGRFLRQPLRGPWKEVSSNVFHIGYQALGVTALVGFLIGV